MTKPRRAIGIFQNSEDTKVALKKLDSSRFSLEKVFVIASNSDREREIINTQLCKSLRDRFDLRIGDVVTANSTTATETKIDLSQALIHLDIPVDTAHFYNDLVANGKYLLMIEGNEVDISGAETVLQDFNLSEWVIYEVVREHPEVIIVDRRHLNK